VTFFSNSQKIVHVVVAVFFSYIFFVSDCTSSIACWLVIVAGARTCINWMVIYTFFRFFKHLSVFRD